jgi:hypothetical protein
MTPQPFPYASQAFSSRTRTASVAAQCLGFLGLSLHFGPRYPQTADQRVNEFPWEMRRLIPSRVCNCSVVGPGSLIAPAGDAPSGSQPCGRSLTMCPRRLGPSLPIPAQPRITVAGVAA